MRYCDKSEFVGLLKLLRPAKDKTGFFVHLFLVKKGGRSRAAPLSLTAVSEISYTVRSAWDELKNSPADCFSRGDCPAREGVPLPCGNVGVLNPPAERRIEHQSLFSIFRAFRSPQSVRLRTVCPIRTHIYYIEINSDLSC